MDDKKLVILLAKIVGNQAAISAALSSSFLALSKLELGGSSAASSIDELGETLDDIWKRGDEITSMVKYLASELDDAG